MSEIDKMQDEIEGLQSVVGKLSSLLQKTAAALKEPDEPSAPHLWHDLPEVAAALRADAERYRWLRVNGSEYCVLASFVENEGGTLKQGADLDAAVDAARSKT